MWLAHVTLTCCWWARQQTFIGYPTMGDQSGVWRILCRLEFQSCSVIPFRRLIGWWRLWRLESGHCKQELKSSVTSLSEASVSVAGLRGRWDHQERKSQVWTKRPKIIWTQATSGLELKSTLICWAEVGILVSTPGDITIPSSETCQRSWTHRFENIRRPRWASVRVVRSLRYWEFTAASKAAHKLNWCQSEQRRCVSDLSCERSL